VKYYLLLVIALAFTGGALEPITSQSGLVAPVMAQVNGCPRAEVLELYETQNFNAYICQGLNNYIFYRGVSKSNGSSINLTATRDSRGTWKARNGSVLYRINFNELVVTDNGRVILRERVISPP
jgi:hypothetical protein